MQMKAHGGGIFGADGLWFWRSDETGVMLIVLSLGPGHLAGLRHADGQRAVIVWMDQNTWPYESQSDIRRMLAFLWHIDSWPQHSKLISWNERSTRGCDWLCYMIYSTVWSQTHLLVPNLTFFVLCRAVFVWTPLTFNVDRYFLKSFCIHYQTKVWNN